MPLAILSTHSYTAEGGTIRGELVIAEHMTMTKPRLGDRVLLVDDMVDSGHTLEAVYKELPRRFPHITALKTAVLWWKACSVFAPDYYVAAPCPTIPGSTSRSRSTTRWARTNSRRASRPSSLQHRAAAPSRTPGPTTIRVDERSGAAGHFAQ